MNENWPEIVKHCCRILKQIRREGDYQREIENCLKFLGWKKPMKQWYPSIHYR